MSIYLRAQVTGFDVDDFLVDIFYYFDESTKRKAELAGENLMHYAYVTC